MRTSIRKINLNFDYSKNYISYENNISVIFLEVDKAISNIEKRLKTKNICENKKLRYNELLNFIRINQGRNLFYIQKALNYKEMEQFLPDIDSIYGNARLDFYNSIIRKDISRQFVEPYGFIPIFKDTSNAVKINKIYDWLISDLLLKGYGRVYNKETGRNESVIIYKIFKTGDGHGGESLLFENKKTFFDVEIYTDLGTTDFDCLDTTKLN